MEKDTSNKFCYIHASFDFSILYNDYKGQCALSYSTNKEDFYNSTSKYGWFFLTLIGIMLQTPSKIMTLLIERKLSKMLNATKMNDYDKIFQISLGESYNRCYKLFLMNEFVKHNYIANLT